MDRPGIEEDFLDPKFGLKYIGYPALGLVVLSVVVSFFSVVRALGILVMSIGYLVSGIGFLLTVFAYRTIDAG